MKKSPTKSVIYLIIFLLVFFGALNVGISVFGCTGGSDCPWDIFCDVNLVKQTEYVCSDGTCVAGTTSSLEDAANYNFNFCVGDEIYEKKHTCAVDTGGNVCIVESGDEFVTLCAGVCVEDGGTAYCSDLPSVETSAASPEINQATLEGYLSSIGSDASSAEVWFRYGAPGNLINETVKQAKSTVGSFSSIVSGLDANTNYEFQAVVRNNIAQEDSGSVVSFTTLSAEELNVSATGASVGSTTATLYGEIISMGLESSVNVWFRYGAPGNLINTTTSQTKNAEGTFSDTISGLSPSTAYEFQAVAQGGGGEVYSSSFLFNTGEEGEPALGGDAGLITVVSGENQRTIKIGTQGIIEILKE